MVLVNGRNAWLRVKYSRQFVLNVYVHPVGGRSALNRGGVFVVCRRRVFRPTRPNAVCRQNDLRIVLSHAADIGYDRDARQEEC